MQVEIKLDEAQEKTKIIICTREITDEITEMANRLAGGFSKIITGVKDDKIYILKPDEIYSFYSENQKVFARCDSGVYQVKHRLYELEEMLGGAAFIRISNSAIANFDHIQSLDLSIGGTMSLRFAGGGTEFVSRRYVAKIKKHLGI